MSRTLSDEDGPFTVDFKEIDKAYIPCNNRTPFHDESTCTQKISTSTSSTQVKGDTLEYEVKKKFEEINVTVHGVLNTTVTISRSQLMLENIKELIELTRSGNDSINDFIKELAELTKSSNDSIKVLIDKLTGAMINFWNYIKKIKINWRNENSIVLSMCRNLIIP
ncbi:unnamed protein product [Rhizophagus irregularis]|uniref:Uncharacterized protein n=2 Tax=Rhizophagus irregularis TaxID=588596 RepID=A0A915ZJ65_9GLOM|nr:unnamed protein product [Rhizophagus irregularis]CAB5378412.1 unnamed protein product [Rhizophagus irregularis]